LIAIFVYDHNILVTIIRWS